MSEAHARVNYQKTDIYEKLVDDYHVFQSYVDFFVFAASLGYNKNRVVRENYGGENEILWMHLQKKDLYRVLAASIAYQDTQDPKALTDTNRQLEILAQYAAGGAEFAEEEFGDIAGDPTDAIVSFLRADHSKGEEEEDASILGEIKADFEGESSV